MARLAFAHRRVMAGLQLPEQVSGVDADTKAR